MAIFMIVFLLYGLRRTGKTTMIRQIVAGMSDDSLVRAAFIQLKEKDSFLIFPSLGFGMPRQVCCFRI